MYDLSQNVGYLLGALRYEYESSICKPEAQLTCHIQSLFVNLSHPMLGRMFGLFLMMLQSYPEFSCTFFQESLPSARVTYTQFDIRNEATASSYSTLVQL